MSDSRTALPSSEIVVPDSDEMCYDIFSYRFPQETVTTFSRTADVSSEILVPVMAAMRYDNCPRWLTDMTIARDSFDAKYVRALLLPRLWRQAFS